MNYALATARQVTNEYGRTVYQFEESYAQYFLRFDFSLLVVTSLNIFDTINQIKPPMILLTGGGSVPTEYYTMYNNEHEQQKQRNEIERKLISYALDHDIPLIGICRGMQMINGFLGGKLTRGPISLHPVDRTHLVHMSNCGTSIVVNSFHDDVVEKEYLAETLKVLAIDENGSYVEAFLGTKRKILGLQWHPERLPSDVKGKNVTDNLIKKFLLSSCFT